MYCKHCGTQIDDDSIYCNKCGKQQNKEEQNEKSSNKNDSKFLIVISIILVILTIFIVLYFTNIKDNGKTTTDTSTETNDTSKDTSDYIRQAGINDLYITKRENYPTSIYYIITAKRDIYDLEIDLEEYAKDGTLTRTVHFNISNLKQNETYTMKLDISNYTNNEINNIDIVYVRVVNGTTSSLTVLPVA